MLLLGAALAPPLFWACKGFVHIATSHGWDKAPVVSGITAFLRKIAFTSCYDRAALIAALLGLRPLFKAMQLQRSEFIGTTGFATGWKQLLTGFILAVVLIIIMGVISMNLGVYKMARQPAWAVVAMPLISGLSVAFLEEFLFRGAVLSVLTRSLGARGGILWTTLIFAIVHFLKPPAHEAIADADVTWSSGFWVITQLFRGFGQWQDVIAEFLLLAGVGWMLALARRASSGLWAGIGLHAGWVAGMKYFSQITATTTALREGRFSPWMVENHCKAIVSSTVGLVPLITVLLTGWIMLWWCKRHCAQNHVAASDE